MTASMLLLLLLLLLLLSLLLLLFINSVESKIKDSMHVCLGGLPGVIFAT